jgi:hypothetical protein
MGVTTERRNRRPSVHAGLRKVFDPPLLHQDFFLVQWLGNVVHRCTRLIELALTGSCSARLYISFVLEGHLFKAKAIFQAAIAASDSKPVHSSHYRRPLTARSGHCFPYPLYVPQRCNVTRTSSKIRRVTVASLYPPSDKILRLIRPFDGCAKRCIEDRVMREQLACKPP